MYRVLLALGNLSTDEEGRSRAEMVKHAIDEGFGPTPDMERRQRMTSLMAIGGVVTGFLIGAIGVGVGAVVQAAIDRAVGSGVMKAFGVLGAAPLLALGIVWAVRAQFNEFDYRRWTKQGRPAGHVPSGLSQPKDRDLLAIVLLALLLAAGFWTA